jgi:hypothetical protein
MRCEECRPHVEDYFDGELDEQTVALVTGHLRVCEGCATLYRKLEDEHDLYLRYECESLEPRPAFWDNVMARVAEENAARPARPLARLRGWLGDIAGSFNAPRLSPSFAALIVLVAIGITVAVMRSANTPEKAPDAVSTSRMESAPATAASPAPDESAVTANPIKDDEAGGKGSGRDENGQTQLVKTGVSRKARLVLAASNGAAGRNNLKPPTTARSPTPDDLVREAEQKYVAAIAMLSRDINRRRARLDPATAARFERTLTAVDRTIADTRRAARRYPNDPVAAQYMLTAYAKKVDVLREIIGY